METFIRFMMTPITMRSAARKRPVVCLRTFGRIRRTAGADADEHLREPDPRLVGGLEGEPEDAAVPEVGEADDGREGEDEERHPPERDEELHLELLAEGAVREERLDDRHRAAERERGEEEVERDERRVPERVELRRDDQVEGPERGLVERREEDAEDDEDRHDRVEDVQRLRHLETLEDDRAELEREDRRVERDAPADLEHDRVRVPHDERVPDVPGATEVEHQRDDDEAVAEERRQDGGADDRPELLEVEDVDGRADREAAGGEGDAAEDVESDPDTPRECVGEVRGGGEALEETDDGGVGPEGEDDEEDSPPEREARNFELRHGVHSQCSFGVSWWEPSAASTSSRRLRIQ
jgi:hypothetical protein